MPPATTPRPNELTAANELQNRPAPTVTATPAPELPVITPAAKPTSTPQAATPAPPAKTPDAKPSPTTAGSRYVQAGLFSSRENAQREVAKLKAKGHVPELIVGPASDRARYRIRFGPMAEPAARELQARLSKDGFKSLVVPR
jgi:cell division protein FtsN